MDYVDGRERVESAAEMAEPAVNIVPIPLVLSNDGNDEDGVRLTVFSCKYLMWL